MLLISNSRLGSSDAVSIQLRRFLEPLLEPTYHCHWTEQPQVAKEPAVADSCRLPNELPFRPPLGRGLSSRLWDSVLLPRWMRWRLRNWKTMTGSAYIVVDCQSQAQYALSVLMACGVSDYVLHLMDLLIASEDPLAADSPLGQLIGNARVVRVVSDRLGTRIAHLAPSAEVTPLAADPVFYESDGDEGNAGLAGKPILVSSGNLYKAAPEKLRFLKQEFLPAWCQFQKEDLPDAKWVHCGPKPPEGLLPHAIENQIHFTGFLSALDYRELLRSSRCALLPLEHLSHEGWKHSLPSRLIDYLAVGIPTLLPPCRDTATADFADAHSEAGFYRLTDRAACLSALRENFLGLDNNAVQRERAHKGARMHHPDQVRKAFLAAWTPLKENRAASEL